MAQQFEEHLLEPELRPEFIENLKAYKNEKTIKISDFTEDTPSDHLYCRSSTVFYCLKSRITEFVCHSTFQYITVIALFA